MTVVIDPGHGGDDRGAVGPAGVEEKQVTLNVAHRLRALGGERGVRVLLTRDDDRQVSLMQRAAFANGAGAVAFVSLHANASPSPLSSGAVVASLGGVPEAAPAAPLDERSLMVPLPGGGSRRVAVVQWEQAQMRHAEVAAELAKQIGERLGRIGALGPRAVYRSPLRPLTPINVPAVLVDLGYLSNPQEEKLAAGEMRQTALAQALLEALLAFDFSPRPAPRPRTR
jgi:N-acetylmuramoyl-L-alanine amidase